MKYIFLLIAVSFVLQSCSKNLDGSKTFGMKGSGHWWEGAPLLDRKYYIIDKQTYQLCSMWDIHYRGSLMDTKVRETISELLIDRKEDPMLCRNPGLDKAKRLEDRVEEAERRARNAEKKAEDAEWEAEQAKRKARAERRARDW